jgi:hypothetical protein
MLPPVFQLLLAEVKALDKIQADVRQQVVSQKGGKCQYLKEF